MSRKEKFEKSKKFLKFERKKKIVRITEKSTEKQQITKKMEVEAAEKLKFQVKSRNSMRNSREKVKNDKMKIIRRKMKKKCRK